jgi:hypothetical protein
LAKVGRIAEREFFADLMDLAFFAAAKVNTPRVVDFRRESAFLNQ